MIPESPTHPFVSIIILNFNGADLTVPCLESLRNLNYSNYELLVVDNGSTDRSAERIAEGFPEVHLVRQEQNLGFVGGHEWENRACAYV